MNLRGGRSLDLTRGPLVMGIVNVTPDSFSDGGLHYGRDAAVEASLRMIEDGAAVIDVGGESTRPGADPVPVEEELERVVPVIAEIRRRSDVVISVDSRNARVAAEAIEAGADIVNDVSAMRHDPEMPAVVARSGAAVVLMHMRGEPKTMQNAPHYDDVVEEVSRELSAWRDDAVAAGVDLGKIFVDPGIGFGKTYEHNLALLAHTSPLAAIAPLVVGASRKGFVGHLTGQPAGVSRMAGSLAAVAAAARGGAAVVRVHDVRQTVDFLAVHRAIEDSR